ncbi:MAG: hypothetical protein ACO1RT_15335 [Planctomycetaceae bacterium]
MIRLLLLLALLSIQVVSHAADAWQWTNLADLPDALGLGGPIVGTSGNALIVAGGANFPNGPPWPHNGSPAGSKVWHDRIHALDAVTGKWIDAGRLPRPLAYAAAISTPEGIYVLGGETVDGTNRASAEVLLLRWNADTRQVAVSEDALPPLPRPSQYHQAALIDRVIYVVASHATLSTSRRLDAKALWSLDLNQPPESRRWNELEPWPGRPREKMAIAVQYLPTNGPELPVPCLFLFSGENWYKDAAGQPDLEKYETFTDAYRYQPRINQWTRIADLPVVPEVSRLPRPAVAAAAIAVDRSRVLLFSGANDLSFHLPVEQRPPFPAVVLEYHTGRDAWTIAGQMPIAVVTTSAVQWNDRIVIPSGEVRPGIRTNRIQSLSLSPPSAGD